MEKTSFFKKWCTLFAVAALMLTTVSSCSDDYQSDIDSLSDRVTAVESSLASIKTQIGAGATITNVASTSTGITITLSDGNSYDLSNGSGTAGSVVTIGDDGFLYIDGDKTDISASDCECPESATGSIVAVVNENGSVTISGLVDADGNSMDPITLGDVQLTSVAFIPTYVDEELPYAVTTDDFYHLESYLTESSYVALTYEFIPKNWDKSNSISMLYRLNPANAVVTDVEYSFINRTVTTKADGDASGLLSVASFVNSTGQVDITALYNVTKSTSSNDIVALQAVDGSREAITSDYVLVESTPIKPSIIMKSTTPVYTYATRIQAIPTSSVESDSFVKGYISLTDAADLYFYYDGSIDLANYVDLYSADLSALISKYTFGDVTYKFSLPENYLAADTQNTNQQWFVKLNGSVLSVNTDDVLYSGIQAVGRTPVVRVDAYMTSNAGVEQMVASAYIKLQITEEEVVDPDQPDKDDVTAQIDAALYGDQYIYQNLTSVGTLVGEMDWTDVNNYIYGQVGLTSTNFWGEYGGTTDTYTVKLTVEGTTPTTLINEIGVASDQLITYTNGGITTEILLNSSETTTSNIKVTVDNTAMSDITYASVDGKGALYTLTITIESDDVKKYGDVVLTQEFYVKNETPYYTYNTNYYRNSYNGVAGDYVTVKGQLDLTWVMSSYIGEHFEIQSGDEIFDYVRGVNNVLYIDFDVATVDASTAAINNDNEVYLIAALTGDKVITMNYTTPLVNGEKIDYSYNVIFVNPFAAAETEGTSINGNTVGTQTKDVNEYVTVIESAFDARTIYSWNALSSAFELSSVAEEAYKMTSAATISVEYAFKADANYTAFVGNLTTNSELSVGTTSGVVTWVNQGTILVADHKLTIVATVTFDDLSIVEVEIPFAILAL